MSTDPNSHAIQTGCNLTREDFADDTEPCADGGAAADHPARHVTSLVDDDPTFPASTEGWTDIGWNDLPTERSGRITYDEGDEQSDNESRATAGMAAIRLYASQAFHGPEEPKTALGDLLGDLRHACDALGLDFDQMSERGAMHYEAELRGHI